MPSGAKAGDAAPRHHLFSFAALSASYFAHIGFFNPYLSLWLKDLGFGLLAISVLASVQSATRLFAPYVWGWLSDHSGERVKLLRYGATTALVLSMGLWMELGVVPLFFLLLLMFTHTSGMMPMSEAALAHLVSEGGAFDARRYGRVRLWGSLGFLLTVTAAGWWFEHRGMGDFPAWTLATLGAVALSTWLLPNHKEPVQGDAPARPPIWPVLQQAAVRWLLASAFFHVLAHIFIYVFFSLYLDALGYSKATIGILWAVSVVVEIGWFFTQGRWLPRLPLTGWLLLAAVLMTVRMVITAGAPLVWPFLLLAQALHAVTFATHHTVCIALISHHFPGRLRGRGQALYTVVAYGSSGILGGVAGGVVSSRWGLETVFWVSAACAGVASLCAWRLMRLEHPAPAHAAP